MRTYIHTHVTIYMLLNYQSITNHKPSKTNPNQPQTKPMLEHVITVSLRGSLKQVDTTLTFSKTLSLFKNPSKTNHKPSKTNPKPTPDQPHVGALDQCILTGEFKHRQAKHV